MNPPDHEAHHRGAKAQSALNGATHSLPALTIHTRSASSVAVLAGRGAHNEPVASSRASHNAGRSSSVRSGVATSSILTPIQRMALNDAPFLVKDKVKAMEQFAVMAAPRRPGARGGGVEEGTRSSRAVPLPVTVVGMQSSGVSTLMPKPPSPSTGFFLPRTSSPTNGHGGIDPDVHEAIIAETVAKLTTVFQHRLQEHAIAATLRHFTKDLLVPETASRLSRPHTILDMKPTPHYAQSQSARLPTLAGYDASAAMERAIQHPPASSLLCRSASPGSIWKPRNNGSGGGVLVSPRRLVPVQPNMSSTTPTYKQRDVPAVLLDKHNLLRHPAITAPWATSGREPQTKVLGETISGSGTEASTLTANLLLQQQRLLAAEADDGDHVPLAEAALNRILLGGHVVDDVEGFAPPSQPPQALISVEHESPPQQPLLEAKISSTKRLARKGPATSGPSRQGGTASGQGGLMASHDLAMAIAQLLDDDDDQKRRTPQVLIAAAPGKSAAGFDFHDGRHEYLSVAAARTQQREHTPRGGTTTSPRSSDVVEHITYDPVLQRWVSSRPMTSDPMQDGQQGRKGVLHGGVDDDIPRLVIGGDDLVTAAAAASSSPRGAKQTRKAANGEQGHLELAGDRAMENLLVSPFARSARLTPSLDSIKHDQAGSHGSGSKAKRHLHHPLSPLTGGPRSPLFPGGAAAGDTDGHSEPLSPVVEKKSLFAAHDKRKANAQRPVGHDSSNLLHFDESFSREQEAALREAAAAAAAKASKRDRLQLLRNTTRAAMSLLSESIHQSAAGGIPQRVKELLPVPMGAEIAASAAISATSPRLLSADQATLEAQVEREVIQAGYDNILGPARDVKSKVDASAELLQQAIQLKLQYREQLVKKYDALQNVKSSHGDVMQTMTALHNCIAAGKQSVDHISLDVLMASINTLTSMDDKEHHASGGGSGGGGQHIGHGQRKSLGRQSVSDATGGGGGGGVTGASSNAAAAARYGPNAGRRTSITTSHKGGGGRKKSTTMVGGATSDSSARNSDSDGSQNDSDAEGYKTTEHGVDGSARRSNGAGGGRQQAAKASSSGKSKANKISTAGSSASLKGAANGAAPTAKAGGKAGGGGVDGVGGGGGVGGRRQQDVSFAGSDEDHRRSSTPSRSSYTADLLRQAQRAKSSTSSLPPSASMTAPVSSTAAASLRPRDDSRHTAVSEAPPPLPPPHAVLIMRKAFIKSTATYRESKHRYDHSQALMIQRGRALVKARSSSTGSGAHGSDMSESSNMTTPVSTKRIPAALEAKLAAAVAPPPEGLSASEEKELISAAITDELQAEFRDITARRDSQRVLAERQEKELEELRHDMKRLTSGSEASRDETAAQLASLIQRRDRSAAEEKARASNALLGGYTNNNADDDGAAGQQEDDDDANDAADDIRDLVEGRQQVGFVETTHAAVQVEEDQLPLTSAQQTTSAEQSSQLGDLYRLERLLIQSVRRLMVAVAHVMLFHDAISIELTCKRCLNIFNAPQMLWPCGHVFCHDCLQSMYDATSELLTCVECGTLADIGFTPEPVLQNLGFYQHQFRHYASVGGGGGAGGKKGKHTQQHQQPHQGSSARYGTPLRDGGHGTRSPQSMYGSFDGALGAHDDEANMSRYSSSSLSFASSSPRAGSPVKKIDGGSFDKGQHHHAHQRQAPSSLPDVLRDLLRDLGGAEESRSASPNAVGGSFSSPQVASIEL